MTVTGWVPKVAGSEMEISQHDVYQGERLESTLWGKGEVKLGQSFNRNFS